MGGVMRRGIDMASHHIPSSRNSIRAPGPELEVSLSRMSISVPHLLVVPLLLFDQHDEGYKFARAVDESVERRFARFSYHFPIPLVFLLLLNVFL